MSDDRDLIAAFTRLLGADAVVSEPSEILVYECDASTMRRALPRAIVYPRSADQVAAVVAECSRRGVPFLARGAGTGLSGGAVALEGSVVLALNRMNRILKIDLPNGRAVVEPGVTNSAVSRAVAADGWYYAPDPSSQAVCTVGGNVAHNSGGPHTLKYGVTVNHVLGLQMVLTDGSIVEIGGAERHGYDLLGLVTGSEGTFGIVTRITVRLLRRPAAVRTLLAAFGSIPDAARAVSEIVAAGIVPAALEMMDAVVVEALRAAFGLSFPQGARALLLAEADGPAVGIDAEAARIEAVSRTCGALEVRVARDAEERAKVWTARKKTFGALGRLAPNYYTQDGVIPRTKLTEMLERVREIGERHGLTIANVFHAGDGNLHPCILFDDKEAGARERVLAAGEELLRACVALGGSLTGEHGIGMEKRERMPLMFTEADLAAMRTLRAVFDPAGLCNPGKIFPGGPSCGELSPVARQAAL
jgi:glycolate oxidase